MNLEKLGIEIKEYDKVIEKYPVIKELEDKLDDYTGILEYEYSAYEEIEPTEMMFKQIFDLVKGNK